MKFIKNTPLKNFTDLRATNTDNKELVYIQVDCSYKQRSKIQKILDYEDISNICLTDSIKGRARTQFYRIYNAIKDDMNSENIDGNTQLFKGEGPWFSSHIIKKSDLSEAWEELHKESN